MALVMALVFIFLVGIFMSAALDKSQGTLLTGGSVRVRGDLQYALDGGVDRALQDLRAELKAGTPTSCTDPSDADGTGTLTLNNQTASYTCTTLAGRAAVTDEDADTNYAIVVTSPNAGALTTQSGVSATLKVSGSIYLNGQVQNSALNKPLQITEGDLVSPLSRSGCQTDLDALTQVSLTGTGQLRACTEQSLAKAQPNIVLPAAPTFNVSTALLGALEGGVLITTSPGVQCRVFYPGLYTKTPKLQNGDHAYFVSGLHYFDFARISGPGGAGAQQWAVENGMQITGGQRSVSTDTAVPAGNCSTMTDAVALADPAVATILGSITANQFAHGVTWVFGGDSSVNFVNGTATLFTPPIYGASDVEVNFVAPEANGNGYTKITFDSDVLSGGSNNTEMSMNAKLYAPSANVDVFSTNSTVAAARGGVIGYEVDLKASGSGSDALAISARQGVGKPRPPFRTVKIVTRDNSGSSTAVNVAVVKISNFSPYTVTVLSWRTGTD